MKNDNIVEDEYACINCGGRNYQYVYSGRDRLHGLPGDFKVFKCIKCDLHTLRPKLSQQEMSAYYPEDYLCYVNAVEDETNWFQYLNRLLGRERRVRSIQKRTQGPGRILDIGCATGILLSGMQKKGWECYGVEPDENAAEYARQRFGFEVHTGYLEEAAFQENYFDVVTLMDVLEHVYDPHEVIKEALRILKPGGLLIGSLPNADAWERSLFGPYWVGWEVPRHYRTFASATLKQFLIQKGFSKVELFSYTGRHGAFVISFNFWLDELDAPDWYKQILSGFFGSIFARLIMLPIFYFLEKLNKSTILSFSAQKGK